MKKIFLLLSVLLLFNIVYAQEVSNNIKFLLSSQGKALYGDEPNAIVVIDYPENIQAVADYLKVVDALPSQVFIDARVVEVKLQKEHSLGVNWTAFASSINPEMNLFRNFGYTGPYKVAGTSSTTAVSQSIPYKATYYPPGGSSGAETPFTLTIFDRNMEYVLKTLANELETNVLSAPRVTTVNNREAEIKVVQNIPWAEPEVTMSDQGLAVTWKINFEEVGINLKVTPTISEDGKITMVLNPEVSEKTADYPLTVTQGTTTIPYTVPVIDKRTASTKVVIGDGQTLIIGGMIKDKVIKEETKVPLVGDIPILGYLFKSKKTTKEKTELLIFVSPTVINSQELSHMARQERFGPGRSFAQDRDRQEKMMIVLENKENQNKIKLSSEWDALVKQQRELTESTEWLEQAVFSEENNLKNLEQAKSEVISREKKLTPK